MATRTPKARGEAKPPEVVKDLRELPLVALRETVIFPEMIVPLQVGRDSRSRHSTGPWRTPRPSPS